MVADHEHLQFGEQGERAMRTYVEVLVQGVDAIRTGRVRRGRENVLVTRNDDDVGRMSTAASKSASYWHTRGSTDPAPSVW